MAKVKNETRKGLVNLAMSDPIKAADELRKQADALAGCKTTEDIFFALSEIYGVSERTIFRDLT